MFIQKIINNQSNLFNVNKFKNKIKDNTILKSYIVIFKSQFFIMSKFNIMSVFL